MKLPIAIHLAAAFLGCARPDLAPATRGAAAPPRAATAHTLRGRVLDHAGAVPRLGHVHLIDPAGKVSRSLALAPDGGFALNLGDASTPIVRVDISALGDRALSMIVVAADAADPTLFATIQLPSYARAVPLAPAMRFREPQARTANVPLVPQPGGTYAAEVSLPDGTYHYQLTGVVAGAQIAGTAATSVSYDGDGDYLAELDVHGGRARIVFDPAAWPAGPTPARLTVSPATTGTAALAPITLAWRDDLELLAPEAAQDLGRSAPAHAREALALATATRDPAVRDLAEVAYFGFGYLAARAAAPAAPAVASSPVSAADAARAAALLTRLPPTSPAWNTFFPYPVIAAAGGFEPHRGYVRTLVAQHPNLDVAGLYLALTLEAASPEQRRALLSALDLRRFAGTRYDGLARFYDPDHLLAVGQPMPAFSVPRLDGIGELRSSDLTRTAYLVDLWATWCAPCVADMPILTSLHERLGKPGRGNQLRLRILSISLDHTREDVARFRTTRFAMPLDHGFAGPDRDGALFRALGLTNTPIPFKILVGPDGKILATSPDLTLDKIPQLLEAHARATKP